MNTLPEKGLEKQDQGQPVIVDVFQNFILKDESNPIQNPSYNYLRGRLKCFEIQLKVFCFLRPAFCGFEFGFCFV